MSETAPNVQTSDKDEEIKARREARRRRILENAKNRLEKLNGRIAYENQNGHVEKSKEIYPDPETEILEDFPFQQNHFTTNFSVSDHNLRGFGSQDINSTACQENIFELFNNFSQIPLPTDRFDESPAQHPPKNTLLSKILKTKVHLALISLLTYVLFCTGNESWISYSVFFPLLLWELIEYFLLKCHQTQETSLFGVVLLISGMSPVHSNALLKTLGTMNKIFKDVGVFVFFFVLYHIFATKVLLKEEPEALQPVFSNRDEM